MTCGRYTPRTNRTGGIKEPFTTQIIFLFEKKPSKSITPFSLIYFGIVILISLAYQLLNLRESYNGIKLRALILEDPHSIVLKLQPAVGGISTDVFVYLSCFRN
jgi:hypothetical protein